MQIKEMGIYELRRIYAERLASDFPPNELRELSLLEKHFLNGNYHPYGLFDCAREPLAYAFVFCDDLCSLALLDYIAVDRAMRGEGLGSLLLKLLRAELSDTPLIAEAEDPAALREPRDREIAERRLRFYDEADYVRTGFLSSVTGAEFVLLSSFESELIDKTALLQMYKSYFPKATFKNDVAVRHEKNGARR